MATEGHPIWVEGPGEWREAGQIAVGDLLRTGAGTFVQVTAVRHFAQKQVVYNLTVSGLHTYFVQVGNSSVLTHNCGGAAPVQKGQDGVEDVVRDLVASGGKVLGREVTMKIGKVRTRPDVYVELPCGTKCFIEVKNGPRARHTSNQSTGCPILRARGGTPVGKNAREAGLTPGQPIDAIPVWTVWLNRS